MYYDSAEQPCSDALLELRQLYLRVQTPAAALRLWERGLTSVQQQQLGGDLNRAYMDSGRTIGMWARLRRNPPERALVEVAHALGFINNFTGNWLLRECGLSGALGMDLGLVPQWCKDRGVLLLGGQVARRVSRPDQATNVVRILDAFEEEGWPPRIDDPLPGGRNQKRLHRTIAVLNPDTIGMKFHADGSGEGIRWELTPAV